MTYIYIEGGQLKVSLAHDGYAVAHVEPATHAGAVSMGEYLNALGIDFFLCSSSVDHPNEYGGEDIDYRHVISSQFSEYKVRDWFDEHGEMSDFPGLPRSRWKSEVDADRTLLSYQEWVTRQMYEQTGPRVVST